VLVSLWFVKWYRFCPAPKAGHDNGGMVAYTFARLYPKAARGVMILDSPIPGIEPWEEVKADPILWHFGFHQTPNLPEKLIPCQQFFYFREFFNRLALNSKAITDHFGWWRQQSRPTYSKIRRIFTKTWVC